MKNISLSKITFFLLILILVIVSFVWDNSYKIENIFLVLLILQNLKINTISMPLIVFFFLIILLKTELPWMLLLQSLYENDELRSAE